MPGDDSNGDLSNFDLLDKWAADPDAPTQKMSKADIEKLLAAERAAAAPKAEEVVGEPPAEGEVAEVEASPEVEAPPEPEPPEDEPVPSPFGGAPDDAEVEVPVAPTYVDPVPVEETETEPEPPAKPLPGVKDVAALLGDEGSDQADDAPEEAPADEGEVDPVEVEAVVLEDRRQTRDKPKVSAVAAAVMSIVPGAGHFYLGQVGKAVLFLTLAFGGCCASGVSTGVSMLTIVTIAIVDAYLVGRRIEKGERVGPWKFF